MDSNVVNRERIAFFSERTAGRTNGHFRSEKSVHNEQNGFAENELSHDNLTEMTGDASFFRSSFFSQFSSFKNEFMTAKNDNFFSLSLPKKNVEYAQKDDFFKESSLNSDYKRDNISLHNQKKEDIAPKKIEDADEAASIKTQKEEKNKKTTDVDEKKMEAGVEEGDFMKNLFDLFSDLKNFLQNSGKENIVSHKKNFEKVTKESELVKKVNFLLKKISQLAGNGGEHKKLENFLKDFIQNIANISNNGEKIGWKKSLEDLMMRYQDLKVDKKVFQNPLITSVMVEKERPETFFSGNSFGNKKHENFLKEGMNNFSINNHHAEQKKHNNAGHSAGSTHSAGSVGNLLANKNVLSASFSQTLHTQQAAKNEFLKQQDSFSFARVKESNLGNESKSFGAWHGAGQKSGVSMTGGLGKNGLMDIGQKERIMEAIVGKIRQNYRGGQETFSLKLNPRELGSVDVWMKKENGKLTVRLTVESHAVKEALQSSLSDMANHLSQNNIDLSSLDVQVGDWSQKKDGNDDFSSKLQDSSDEKNDVKTMGTKEMQHSIQWSLSDALQRFYA